MTGTISNVTRVESWSYFQPKIDPLALTQGPIGDPDYTFIGDRAELGVRVDGSRFELSGAFNYVRLENLPTNAIGPGGLGIGRVLLRRDRRPLQLPAVSRRADAADQVGQSARR